DRAVPSDLAGDLSAAGRMSDEDDVAQVESLDQLGEIIGVGFHIVAVPRLARSTVAAPVVANRAKAVGCHGQHLGFPSIGVEGPAVAEDDRLPSPPVLVIDLCSVPR